MPLEGLKRGVRRASGAMLTVFSEREDEALDETLEQVAASRKSMGASLTASKKEQLRNTFHDAKDAGAALDSMHDSQLGISPEHALASAFSADELFDMTRRRTRQSTALSQQGGGEPAPSAGYMTLCLARGYDVSWYVLQPIFPCAA